MSYERQLKAFDKYNKKGIVNKLLMWVFAPHYYTPYLIARVLGRFSRKTQSLPAFYGVALGAFNIHLDDSGRVMVFRYSERVVFSIIIGRKFDLSISLRSGIIVLEPESCLFR